MVEASAKAAETRVNIQISPTLYEFGEAELEFDPPSSNSPIIIVLLFQD